MTKLYRSNLLIRSLHEKNLIIFKKISEYHYEQRDITELREDDVVFFRHPENFVVLVGEKGSMFFRVTSLPFCKNGLYLIDLEELIIPYLIEDNVSVRSFTSETVIGKAYLRLV